MNRVPYPNPDLAEDQAANPGGQVNDDTITGPIVSNPHNASTAVAIVGGRELVKPTIAEIAEILGGRTLDMRAWLAALTEAERFEETDAEDASLSIVKAIVLAASSEQVYAAMDMKHAKDLCGEDPGGRSNVLRIHGAFPLESTFEDGPSCFSVISATDLAENTDLTFSCGARAVQAAIWAHMYQGWMPMTCSLVRRRKPTRNQFYPLNLESGV